MSKERRHHQEPNSFGQMTAKTFLFSFGLLGIGTSTLILVTLHDTIVKYGDSLKWLIFITFAILIVLVLVFIAVNMFLVTERRALENEIFKQNNLLPRTINDRKPVVIENKKDTDEKEEFINFTDQKTHEIYCEMIETDTFSLNKLALEIHGNTGGEYNKKLRKSLSKFGVNI